MKILITGVAGFIGSHCAEEALRRGWSVVGIDSFDPYYSREIKRKNLVRAAESSAFSLHEIDILSDEFVQTISREKPDAVLHLAALAGVLPSLARPRDYVRVNVEGTAALLEASRVASIRNVVMASSSSVYGERSNPPFREVDGVAPASVYAASKVGAEYVAQSYSALYGLNVTAFRFFTVYGPRQRPDMAISRFFSAISRGEEIELRGDGATYRDYTFVEDVVRGIFLAIERPGAGCRILNLGCGAPVGLTDLIFLIEKVVGRDAAIRYVPRPKADVSGTWADPAAAIVQLGWRPEVQLDEGLRRYGRWLLASGSLR